MGRFLMPAIKIYSSALDYIFRMVLFLNFISAISLKQEKQIILRTGYTDAKQKTTMVTYRNDLYTMALVIGQSNRVSPSAIPCPSDKENASATQFNAASWSPA